MKIVCFDVCTCTKMLKQFRYFKQNYTLKLFIAFKIASYSCCFGLNGNLDFRDFLKKKFITSTIGENYCTISEINLSSLFRSGCKGSTETRRLENRLRNRWGQTEIKFKAFRCTLEMFFKKSRPLFLFIFVLFNNNFTEKL